MNATNDPAIEPRGSAGSSRPVRRAAPASRGRYQWDRARRHPVARALGRLATQLGRYDEADTHLRRALEVSERMHAPYWIARTQLDLAELCIARQHPADSEKARDLIQTARGSAERHGYGGLLPRIERLLAKS
jgi:tetratricopeptide (TPR) repeat protein